MIRYSTLILFAVLFTAVIPGAFAQDPSIGFTNNVATAATNKVYGWGMINRLTEADLLIRQGEWQEAIMTYEQALAQQSDWIPALVGQAEVLTLMGRKGEAEQALRRARLIDRGATEVLLSYKLKKPARFMALFPQQWMSEQLQLPVAEQLWIDAESPDYDILDLDYFNIQANQLSLAPDSVAVFSLLKAQFGSEVSELPREIDPYLSPAVDRELEHMIRGNIQLMYRNPNQAIYHYTKAIEMGTDIWPEVQYNRGLTFIFMYRYGVGCQDLQKSAEKGFRPALAMLKHLCNF